MFKKNKRMLLTQELINQLLADMSNDAVWNDYDENGIPYWNYLWNEDPITGDAWRLIKR